MRDAKILQAQSQTDKRLQLLFNQTNFLNTRFSAAEQVLSTWKGRLMFLFRYAAFSRAVDQRQQSMYQSQNGARIVRV